ncbi:MAG: type I-MYXAN CRISPR-associated protein Cas6/Cmx6, partial [Xenococcus sp. (in: cyanobacteria)]
MIEISCVDLAFPLKGKSLPLDNGYIVYSALSRICPNLHRLTISTAKFSNTKNLIKPYNKE